MILNFLQPITSFAYPKTTSYYMKSLWLHLNVHALIEYSLEVDDVVDLQKPDNMVLNSLY